MKKPQIALIIIILSLFSLGFLVYKYGHLFFLGVTSGSKEGWSYTCPSDAGYCEVYPWIQVCYSDYNAYQCVCGRLSNGKSFCQSKAGPSSPATCWGSLRGYWNSFIFSNLRTRIGPRETISFSSVRRMAGACVDHECSYSATGSTEVRVGWSYWVYPPTTTTTTTTIRTTTTTIPTTTTTIPGEVSGQLVLTFMGVVGLSLIALALLLLIPK